MTKHFCDRCEKEVARKEDLTRILIPQVRTSCDSFECRSDSVCKDCLAIANDLNSLCIDVRIAMFKARYEKGGEKVESRD